MKFGVCRGLDDFEAIKCAKNAGLDYLETGFGCLANFDNEKFNYSKSLLEEVDLQCLAANGFIPGDMKLVGDSVDYGAISDYLDRGFERADILGVKKIVLGSGAARSFPEGYSPEKAKEQVAYFLSEYAAPRAKKCGCIIVLEPLRYGETTMIHTVSDGVEISDMCGCGNVFALADLYHVYGNNDDIDGFRKYKGKICHCHIAEPEKRVYPAFATPEINDVIKHFLDTMAAVGCDTCSIEARTDDFEKDIVDSISFLKAL